MLWGWLPAMKLCLSGEEAGIDPVKWRCTREVPQKQRAKTSSKVRRQERCNIKVTPRRGTWLISIKKSVAEIMTAIFMWSVQELSGKRLVNGEYCYKTKYGN